IRAPAISLPVPSTSLTGNRWQRMLLPPAQWSLRNPLAPILLDFTGSAECQAREMDKCPLTTCPERARGRVLAMSRCCGRRGWSAPVCGAYGESTAQSQPVRLRHWPMMPAEFRPGSVAFRTIKKGLHVAPEDKAIAGNCDFSRWLRHCWFG